VRPLICFAKGSVGKQILAKKMAGKKQWEVGKVYVEPLGKVVAFLRYVEPLRCIRALPQAQLRNF
jgi:hypothetical protein